MAMFICEKHGAEMGAFTSPLVADRVIRCLPLSDLDLISLKLHLPYEGPREFKVERGLLEELNVPSEITDETLAFDIMCKLQPVCGTCLDQALGQRASQAIPF